MSSRTAAATGAPLSTTTAEPHAALSPSGPAAGEAAGPSASPAQVEQLRQQIAYALQGQSELRDLLGQCAESNAWTVEEAMQRPDTITTLELFLLQVPRLPLMHFFPNLVTVKLMSIGLESMATFASLTLVEELWLSDNNIRVIEGLDNMTRLRRLYLQGNRIESLQGLPPLRHLRELWLCRNHISVLTHLTPLRRLRSLYISSNPIESLEGAFSKDMSHLHDVNLSGCYITSVTELRHLQQLTCLRHLWLLDPLFGDNPVCRLNNYVTLTLALLGSLDSLDGAYVTPEQRALVESVLHKKKSYYAMRAQMLDAQLLLLARHAESLALRHTQKSGLALRQLQACLQPIQHELAERSLYGLGEGKAVARAASAAAPTTAAAAASAGASTAASGGSLTRLVAGVTESENPTAMRDDALPLPPATSALEELARTLSRAVGTREVQERTTLLRLAEATHAAAEQARLLKERFAVELHTAGNVRLENLAPDHEAYVAAADLVRERFDRSLFEERFGIAGVEVTSVRRVVNRGLRVRFDDRVKELHVDLANPQLRSRFVGLFGIVPATAQGQSTLLQHTLLSGTAARPAGLGAAVGAGGEDGRRTAAAAVAAAEALAFQPVPLEEGVPLTNSLFYADEARLLAGGGGLATAATTRATSASTASRGLDASTALSQRSNSFGLRSAGGGGGGAGEAGGLYRGQVVLYRVYLGKTVHALGGAAGSAALPPNSFLHMSGRVWRRDYGPDTCAAYRLLPTSPSGPACRGAAGPGDGATPPPLPASYMWYCFDRALLLPDCVVDYAYALRSDSPPAASPLTNSSTSSPRSPRDASPCMSRAAAEALLNGSVLSPTSSSDACGAVLGDGDASSPSLPPRARQRASDVVEDVLRCGESLLQFMHWCSCSSSSGGGGAERRSGGFGAVAAAHGNTLQQVADAETKEALAQVARGLGAAQAARLLGRTDAAAAGGPAGTGSPDSNSDGRRASTSTSSSGGSANPLQARHIEAYAAQMQVAEGQPLPLCVLRSRGLTAVLQDFGAPRCATITTLDLAHNRIAAVSWFALAKEAPQLQRLNLSNNTLSRLHLDGSSLPALRELDVSGNDLVNVGDFALIRTAAPVLEELAVHGNPFLQTADGQEAAARLWFYLLPPPASAMSAATSCNPVIVKVNSHSLGAFPGTLAVQRFRRACLLPGGRPTARMTGVTTLLVQAVQREEERGGGPAAAAVFSVDGVTMPEYCFEQAAARLEQLEAAGDVEAVLRDSLGASHDDGGGAVAGLQDCQSFRWSRGLMGDARGLAGLMPNLCHLTLRGQALTDVAPLLHLRRLVRLNLAENHLSSLPCLAELKTLTELVLDFNHLTSLPASVGPLPALRTLSAAGNQIESVDIGLFAEPGTGRDGASIPSTPLPAAPQLEALYLMHNYIADMNLIYALRDIPSLLILSVLGNPCTVVAATAAQEEQDSVRPYLIHVFPQLKVLDGVPVSPGEAAKAREEYAGKINSDLLLERTRCQPETWASVQTLNLSHCSLKEVNLLEPFVALEVLQLQHNLLVNVTGVAMLTRLTALDLSHNRLGALPWRSSMSVAASNGNGTARNGGANAGASAASTQASSSSPAPYTLGDVLAPLKRLQSLSLEANQISDLSTLKLRFPHLKFLNVRGNELQFIQRGLENLPELRELLLDQNKLRSLSPDAFAANRKLSILSAENNALRSVEGLQRCAALEQLRLAANRLGELNALLHDLQGCPLRLAVFLGNPIARKTNYRPTVILRFSTLAELDRRAVTADEREKAATARMTELVAPPNVVFDMSYLPSGGSAAVPSPGQPALTNGVAGGGAVGGGGNGAAPLPSRSRVNGGGAPIAATMVTLTPPPQPLAGVRAPLVANKRGVASDRFAVNARSRQYRR